MQLTLIVLLTFIIKSSQFEMYSHLHARLGVKGLNLICQQRNIRIMNPLKVPKVAATSPSLTALSSTIEDEEDDLPQLSKNPKTLFIEATIASINKKEIQKLFLSENRQVNHDGSKIKNLKSITGRLIEIKAGLRFQLVYRYLTNDITKNLPIEEVEEALRGLLSEGFKKATLTSTKEMQELSLKRGSGSLRIVAAPAAAVEADTEEVPNFQHDRKKNVPVDAGAPFLRALKVTTEGGRPFAGMSDKYRQIQKFVEILGGLVDRSDTVNQKIADTVAENLKESSMKTSDKSELKNIKITDKLIRKTPLRVVDMGSGMAYLTFAAHSHLSQKFDLETIGVEARDNLVIQTNKIAANLGQEFQGLSFVEGNILDYFSLDLPAKRVLTYDISEEKEVEVVDSIEEKAKKFEKSLRKNGRKNYYESNKMDVLVALHACDTATDDAIWCGIQGGAQIIVTAPCCHKQVRAQLDRHIATAPSSDISGSYQGNGNGVTELLQHGIYREREAEMVTDTLRALLLERCGYTTSVFEFVGGEHTAKNVMIAAVKRPVPVEVVSTDKDRIVRARALLAGIEEAKNVKRVEKKKKFQSVSVNEFGDVDDESYAEGGDRDREERGREDKEEEERRVEEVADMIENNNRVAHIEELEKVEAISRRIDTLMKTFGVKTLKLQDLILENEAAKAKKIMLKNKNTNSSEEVEEDSTPEITEKEPALDAEEEKKIKKQLKLRKFRR